MSHNNHVFFRVGDGVDHKPHLHVGATPSTRPSMDFWRSPENFGRHKWEYMRLKIAAAGTDSEDVVWREDEEGNNGGHYYLDYDSRANLVTALNGVTQRLNCGTCQRHIQEVLQEFPFNTFSRNRNIAWTHMWNVHNIVNARLGKDIFPWSKAMDIMQLNDSEDGRVLRGHDMDSPPFLLRVEEHKGVNGTVLRGYFKSNTINPSLLPEHYRMQIEQK